MNKFNSLKAVIFDLGETLITCTVEYTKLEKSISEDVHNLFSKMGYSIPENFYYELKMEMWKNWKEQFGLSETEFEISDFLYHLLCKVGIKIEDVVKFIPLVIDIIYQHDLKYLGLKPTVKETLQELKDIPYLMGIISNTSYSYDHILEILRRIEIIDYFNVVIVSSKEKVCKPNPKIFQKALQSLGVSPYEAIFIGNDPQVDINGAKGVGMESILVVGTEAEMDKIRESDTSMAVRNIKDILKYLKK